MGAEETLVDIGNDSRDFLPPVMSLEEEEKEVDAALKTIVKEPELSPQGKQRLADMLVKYRAAFGMQLHEVSSKHEPVKIH